MHCSLQGKMTQSTRKGTWRVPQRVAIGGRSYGVLVVAFCAGLSSGCDRPVNIVRHPTTANVPASDASVIGTDSVPSGLSPQDRHAWTQERDLVLHAEATVSIGAGGDDHQIFSHVAGAHVSKEGHILIFDDELQELRRFDATGRHMDSLGGLGDGPTELRYARGFVLPGDGSVVVLDQQRLRVFTHDGDRWELSRMISTPSSDVRDGCTLDGRYLFLAGPGHEPDDVQMEQRPLSLPNIHRVDLDTEAVTSFGSGYLSETVLVRWDMSTGHIACVTQNDAVVFGFALTPLVRAYHGTSELPLWESRIEDYVQLGIEQRPNQYGRLSVSWSWRLDHEYLIRLHEGPLGSILLQTLRYSEATGDQHPRTYLVDPRSGAGALISETLPEVASFFAHGYVALLEDPYPRVEVREYVTATQHTEPPAS